MTKQKEFEQVIVRWGDKDGKRLFIVSHVGLNEPVICEPDVLGKKVAEIIEKQEKENRQRVSINEILSSKLSAEAKAIQEFILQHESVNNEDEVYTYFQEKGYSYVQISKEINNLERMGELYRPRPKTFRVVKHD